MKKLNVGIMGYGFMGRAHSNAYRKVNNFFDLKYQPVLKTACARNADNAKAFAQKWGYESVETDWRKLIAREDIDLIDICTPNNTHAEIAIAAAKAGKMILCEKPLALNAKEAEKMVAAVEKAKLPNMVWYNYRRCPAVVLAKQLIDEGKLGRIFHYRAKFLQDWTINPDLPQGGAGLWRLDVKAAGSGVTGDLLAHCIDTALWLNGSIDRVNAMTETFVKERKHNLTGKVEKVGIDDACAFLARFENGSLATFESTRSEEHTSELQSQSNIVCRLLLEKKKIEFLEGAATVGTTHLSAHDDQTIFRVEQARGAATDLQFAPRETTRFQDPLGIDHAHDDVNRVLFETLQFSKLRNGNQFSIDIKRFEPLAFSPVRNISMKTLARFDERREHLEHPAFRR